MIDADGETQNFTITLPPECEEFGDDYDINITALSPYVAMGYWIQNQNSNEFTVRFLSAPEDSGYIRWTVTKKFELV